MKLFVLRSRSVLAAVAVMAFVPLSIAAQRTPHFPTPGTDPAKPTMAPMPDTPAITQDGSVVEDVVVRVNDQIISRSEVERAREQLKQELDQAQAQGQISYDQIKERQDNLLRDLIDKQLLLSKGKELGINADADVVRQLDEIRKQNHLDSIDDLEKAARQQGVSFEDFKAQIRNQIITQQVVRDEVGRNIHMTTAEERKYYDAHKDEFVQPEQVRLSEILVPAAVDSTPEQLAAAKAKADAIHAELAGGAKFADVAKKESGGPTAAQGGELGDFKRGSLAKVLEDATFGLDAGQFTQPIRTRQGYVMLEVTEHQKGGVPPMEEVEGQVQQGMYSEAMGPALRAYLTKLREEAYIDIKPGFVDAGASKDQTKPVFTTYTPPVPKKKAQQTAKERFDDHAQKAQVQNAVVELDKHGKPKKIKREKIRYGQPPRIALPAGPTETAVVNEAAPGTAIAPVSNENTVNVADNPLAPPAPKEVKSRFSHKEVEVKQKKVVVAQKKVAEKKAATPDGPDKQEIADKKVQSSALGLNGETGKKKKKKKHVKGEPKDPKDRLQNKEVKPADPLKQNAYPDKNTGLPVEKKPATTDTPQPSGSTNNQ